MKIEGITVNGVHSYYRHGLRILKRSASAAPKDDYTERVPFSSVTYDFGSVCGRQSYGERTLSYKFELLCFHKRRAQEKIMAILEWLHWTGRKELYDDLLPDYHYEVREPTVNWEEKHGIYTFSVTFKANPHIMPNSNKKYTADTVNFPDVTGDGIVDGTDATLILNAYTNIISGKDPGFSERQMQAADADMDGAITGMDSTLVMQFYTAAMSGEYENSPGGWAEFLNDVKEKNKGVI
ncbi:MAG: dockerin type I domain-containing protein [Ruminococcus flavefaciens]|nr:dockerin type I domain-containing protein [Ruminococcus flavefaciens]MCM1060566.1 dockerin type I domain-containing protein [Eubacterium sp.]